MNNQEIEKRFEFDIVTSFKKEEDKGYIIFYYTDISYFCAFMNFLENNGYNEYDNGSFEVFKHNGPIIKNYAFKVDTKRKIFHVMINMVIIDSNYNYIPDYIMEWERIKYDK